MILGYVARTEVYHKIAHNAVEALSFVLSHTYSESCKYR